MGTDRLQLAIGPMSPEAVEAIFRYSGYHRRELMCIPSKNQVDYAGGYVNGWTTRDFAGFVGRMRAQYPESRVLVCRDHCGPGFNGQVDIADTYRTIDADIENGFDLIHIDFCHHPGNREQRMDAARKAIQHCLAQKPELLLEIGTDENEGMNFSISTMAELEEEIAFFKEWCSPRFYVVQTGSLVMEMRQVGTFNSGFLGEVAGCLHDNGLLLKEHNADYLGKDDILKRRGLVDAMNIAPQLGVIQTSLVLAKCLVYGVDSSAFVEDTYNSGKWRKWLIDGRQPDPFFCANVAGHYMFTSDSYRRIIERLERHEDIHETIIGEFMRLIEHYDWA